MNCDLACFVLSWIDGLGRVFQNVYADAEHEARRDKTGPDLESGRSGWNPPTCFVWAGEQET